MSQIITTIKLKVLDLSDTQKEQVFRAALKDDRILRVDTNLEKQLARVLINGTMNEFGMFKDQLLRQGFNAEILAFSEQPPRNSLNQVKTQPQNVLLSIEGMHCASCEVRIERALQKLSGVQKVDVDAKKREARLQIDGDTKNKIAECNKVLSGMGYRLTTKSLKKNQEFNPVLKQRPRFLELAILFILVWTLGVLLNRLGLLKQGFTTGSSASFGASFVLGLVAATSQCLAVIGGLLLSLAAKFREKYGAVSGLRLAQPILLFSAGRVASYGIFGGFIGLAGQAFSPSPLVTGLITVAAAVFMAAIGLNILHIAPGFLMRLQARAPKGFMRKIHDLAETSSSSWAPFTLGAATFAIPCGFTQSLQIYALSSGSFSSGALALGGFALGTIPALVALWYAGSIFRGKAGQFFFKFAGAAVLLLGFWNIQNGLTVAGYPLRLPRLVSSAPQAAQAAGANVVFDGKQQIVKINVDYSGYTPAEFTVGAGIPVRLEINGDIFGCLSIFQIPKFGIRERLLANQNNVIEFTPNKAGDAVFSCSMGMFRGVMHVVPNT